MKNKLIAAALAVIAIIIAAFVPAAAGDAVVDEKAVIDGIVQFKLKETGALSVQEFIDKSLADGAGASSEWYVIALSGYGNYDFSRYAASLDEYISEGRTLGAATRQKLALAMTAAGYSTDFTDKTVDETLDEGGVMSVIFGLHLLNSGAPSEKYTRSSAARKLIEMKMPDGGWALAGSVSDVDVTAMALTSLAPNTDIDGAAEAAERALAFLSSRQLDNGGYKSMMSDENPESAAQVILALASLGIDYRTDSRFVKNGNTIFDAIMSFSIGDGSFSHTRGAGYSSGATVQVMYSLVGVMRQRNGESPLFVLDAKGARRLVREDAEKPASSVPKYKIIATVAAFSVFVVVCVALTVTKKRSYKNYIAAIVALAAVLLFVWLTTFTATADYYGQDTVKKNPVGSVTITIRCDTIVGKSSDPYIPKDGTVLEKTSVQIEQGETVYDILIQCAKKHGIQVDVDAAGYFSGIANIYQLRFGQLSGWMYFVNGEEASVSADRYVLSDGDFIEWLYTCDIGNDLKK